jgi:ribonuclease HI
MLLIVETDGACRGNPGPMAIGVTIKDREGTELATVSQLIGQGTNNIAEYRAVIEGLKVAKALGAGVIELRMDSELVVRQINGAYKVRNQSLQPLYKEVIELLNVFEEWTVLHIPREENQRADELANVGYGSKAVGENELGR